MLKPRIIIFLAIGVAIIVTVFLVVLSFMQPATQPLIPEQNNGTTQPEGGDDGAGPVNPEPGENPVEEDNSGAFIQNIEPLFEVYSDAQTLFINSSVVNYAEENFNQKEVFIANDYLKKRSNNSYGFSITDGQDNLFYVIATKRPKGNVKVDFY